MSALALALFVALALLPARGKELETRGWAKAGATESKLAIRPRDTSLPAQQAVQGCGLIARDFRE
jgi:hypothetical protein